MRYIYICNKCKKTKTIEQSMDKKLKRDIPCECGGVMNQNFKLKKVGTNIDCTFDSYGEFAPKDFGSSELENYMEEL